MFETILIVIGFIVMFLGLIGCILPVLPGPLLSYLSLLLISWAKDWQPFTNRFLIIMAIVMIVVTVVDYITPLFGAKRYGASRVGIWGSVIGLLIGLIFFPPWGMFIGAFVGALAGELLMGRKRDEALRASWGVFWGTILGIGLKLMASGIMTFYFIQAVFK